MAEQNGDIQNISYRHTSGEVVEVANLESARQVCPVLGQLSLEEAGLLVEMEALGREIMDKEQAHASESRVVAETPEKPQITKQPTKIVKPQEIELHNTIPEEAHAHIPESASALVDAPEVVIRPLEPQRLAHVYEEIVRQQEPSSMTEVHFADKTQISPEVPEHQEVTKVTEKVSMPAPEARSSEIETPPVADALEIADEAPDNTPAQEVHTAEVIAVEQAPEPVQPEVIVPESARTIPTEEITEPVDMIDTFAEDTADIPPDELLAIDETEELLTEPEPQSELWLTGKTDQFMAEPALQVPEAPVAETEFGPAPFVPELPAPIEVVEPAIIEITEAIDTAQDEQSEKLHTIVEEIIKLAPGPEAPSQSMTEQEVEQKLEELFIELLEEAHVAYTPRLVESLIILTKVHYFEKTVTHVRQPEEDDDAPTEIGTREFLQKLQKGLSAMKKAVVNVYHIGRSVLQAYSRSIESTSPSLGLRPL